MFDAFIKKLERKKIAFSRRVSTSTLFSADLPLKKKNVMFV